MTMAKLFPRPHGFLELGGVDLDRALAGVPTPMFILDGDRIGRRYRELRDAVPGRSVEVFYSAKANARVGLLRHLRKLGCGLDACSPGDVAFAEAAGYAPTQISYTGRAMSDREVDFVAKSGVFFVAESLEQLDRYLGIAPGAPIGLRMAWPTDADFHPHVRASGGAHLFGIELNAGPEALAMCRKVSSDITVLHGHLGSDLLNCRYHLDLLDRMITVAGDFPDVAVLDLGGGFGVPFTDEEPEYDLAGFGEGAATLLRDAVRKFELRVEPGTFLVRDAGYLETTVVECRPGTSGDWIVGVDASTNNLIGRLLYDTAHPVQAVSDSCGEATVVTIVGHLMQGGDVLARNIVLHLPKVGERLIFGLAGAYSATRASSFNERPQPAEILLTEGSAQLIRRASSIDDLLAHESNDYLECPRRETVG